MRRPRLIRVIGVSLCLAGLVACTIGVHSSLLAHQTPELVASSTVGGGFGSSAAPKGEASHPIYLPSPPMTLAETKTRLKLHEKLPMRFPNATPLADVVKYIEDSTIDKVDFPEGISIYVDPIGLQDADKSMASTIVINLKNLPLETTLDLLLKQLELTYWITKDGLLIITAASDDLVTPGTLDREILTNLSALREEVHALRTLLRGDAEDRPGANLPPNRALGGVMGGGFR